MFLAGETFGKYIGGHVFCSAERYRQLTALDFFSQEMVTDVYMFRSGMECRIFRQGYSRLIVAVDGHLLR